MLRDSAVCEYWAIVTVEEDMPAIQSGRVEKKL